MLTEIRVETKEELVHCIYKYFEEVNEVPIPYKWTYKMDTIDLSEEDISSIVYDAKAVRPEDTDKIAPKPIERKRHKQTEHK